ncbi:leucine-rich repeat-containing G-protein coupled receptor 5-like [Aricia agestis]|uniref:leucine-rich repeat-containing G-protein coupled receptor 5-like n=1 Tax=Aricia agestis TaxID=91739 RepID=UPI001C20BC59|nr:leucine-rich repeat-containing G-protein coupled receptor 5-like [Aricia agestis]
MDTFIVVWLLLPMALCGVLRDSEEGYDCRSYTYHGLEYLDCADRGLTDLPENISYDAHVVRLANNNFVSFPALLEKFQNVEILDISGNHLTGPLPTYMESWKNLNTLNLSNNNYDSWITTEFEISARKIDLSKNKINRVDEDAFVRMNNLNFLDLSENRIYDLPTTVFAQAIKLEILILSRNYFNKVPNFQSSSLKNLYLSNCQIIYVDVKALTTMQSLLELDLSINQIEYIPDNLASYSLQELDLSYNEINTINDRTFSSLPHLAVLDLRGNEFKEVWSTSHFASNPFLREVLVKGNRWSCEGFSVNLLLTYEFLTKDPPKTSDKGSLICYSPANVTQLSWQQAYIRTWHADENSAESYMFVAVMIGVIIGIIITSFVCRGIMIWNRSEAETPSSETTILNGSAVQDRADAVVLRIPLREDLPPTYDEALLMPRLNSSFHSLPEIIDEEEEDIRRQRRSRSIGDLTEMRPRMSDRRSVRRTVAIHIN